LPGMGLGMRCVSLNPGAKAEDIPKVKPAGSLKVTYKTLSLEGLYAPRNCTAVWIETVDGKYVATLEIRAGLREYALVYWQEHACTEESGPDVYTTATIRDHDDVHDKVSWSGVDFEGFPVPDGPFIEVTETDIEPGEYEEFDFVKGPASSVDAPVAGIALDSVKIEWIPDGH
jgi:hypothetical protein